MALGKENEEEAFYRDRGSLNKTPSSIRTSDLGDSSLSLLERATKAEPLKDKEGLLRAYDQGDS